MNANDQKHFNMSTGYLVKVESNSYWNGVTIRPPATVIAAHETFKSAAMQLVVPSGTYTLLGHDNEIALLQPLANVHPHWAKWLWITEISNIIPARRIYSKRLPIIVDGQDLDRISIHHYAPAKQAKVWRYMSFDKFKRLLETRTIFLSRADNFKDKLEGTLSPLNESLREEIYRNDPQMAAGFAYYVGELKKMAQWTYVSCWRIDETESERCWKEYPENAEEGVAVQTNYEEIARYTAYIFAAKVRYVDLKNNWVIEGNSLMPFMHKDNQYEWENEFRIICQQFPKRDITFDQEDYYACENHNPSSGKSLGIELATFMKQVVITPHASAEFKIRVRNLVGEYGLKTPVVDSGFPASTL